MWSKGLRRLTQPLILWLPGHLATIWQQRSGGIGVVQWPTFKRGPAATGFIREKFGIEMSKAHFSAVESQLNKREGGAKPKGKPGRKPSQASETGFVGAVPKTASSDHNDMIDGTPGTASGNLVEECRFISTQDRCSPSPGAPSSHAGQLDFSLRS